jgi:hypothetical protein
MLGQRQLGRSLLARQHLLERTSMPALAMVEHLVGMQAQVPQQPYVALWSRLEGFMPVELERLILERAVVRIPLMRTTLHLVSGADAIGLRPLMQPVLERTLRSSTPWHRQLDGLDLAALLDTGRAMVEGRPLSTADLAAGLVARWPERDAAAMAQAVRYLLPMVQVPPRGLWTRSGLPRWTTLEAWLAGSGSSGDRSEAAAGREAGPGVKEVVRRYLAAFGPATVADVQTWCGLTGMRAAIEGLRPELVAFRDEAGRERFDVPEAPRPDEDVPAPPRLLPEYDNMLLSHRDRSHVIPAGVAARLTGYVGTFLVDGLVSGQWRAVEGPGEATLVLDPFTPLGPKHEAALVEEAERYLAWHAPGSGGRSVVFGRAR